MIKRAFDCSAALAGTVLMLPLWVIVALLIKLDSPGPVVFRHQRIGRGFRPFAVYKFRTMVADPARRTSEITFGGTADARVTRVGRILRRTKIDELPQLINVMKGEMSLVGPRPEVAEYVNLFRKDYEAILAVRPGLTDFASLKYRDEAALLARAADPAEEYVRHILPDKIRLAKEYVECASLAVDLVMIVTTIGRVVSPGHPRRRRLAE
jgi:lipopolysaccharide/colanic/teichoic acid biosynthesis glycosyltransferase